MRFISRIALASSLIVLAVAGMGSVTHAQTKKDAIEAFNKGYELVQKDSTQAAINKFEQSASIAGKVGPDAKDIQQKAQDQLPPLYYRLAVNAYQNHDIKGAIQGFQKSAEVAQKYGNKEYVQRSKTNVPKLYYALANKELQQGQYQDALDASNKATQLDPNDAKPYYQRGLIYKKMTKMDEALQQFDKAVALAKQTNDVVTRNAAQKAAKYYLLKAGVQAQQKKDYKEAVNLLTKALDYDSSFASAYYRLAETYNKMGEWGKALQEADNALKYEKGSKTDKAKIWFEAGVAQQAMKNKDKACTAFKNASYGSFKASADYKITQELKCNEAQASR